MKFDIVRLDPSGDVIIAGKTKPQIKLIYLMEIKNSPQLLQMSHGDWVWMSDKKIEVVLKDFI